MSHRERKSESSRHEKHAEGPSLPLWEPNKYQLEDIFFKRDDYYKRGSQEYRDFIEFYEKYSAFRTKQSQMPRPESSDHYIILANGERMKLPSRYDPRYKINCSIATDHHHAATSDRDRHTHRSGSSSRSGSSGLTAEQLSEFRNAMLMFEDFQQKKKFAKLQKIKRDRENLPIYSYKDQILKALADNQVIIVAGDTGCGKSTQTPQFLLEAGYSRIACTQPRRISAMSLCRRVSFETLNEYGSQVAFQIRFDSSRTRDTRILFLTEGILLRQVVGDPLLSQYDVLIIDEVHERHITGDFLLGVLKIILYNRPSLKLVLMSATINLQLFSSYFSGAPVIQVPGRLHPITVEFCPPDETSLESTDEELLKRRLEQAESTRSSIPVGKKKSLVDPAPYLKLLERIDQEYPSSERGDVLVFLSGTNEITNLCDELRRYAEHSKKWIILPLHSALSVEDQEKVFDLSPDGVRKCIVSTNIAETSITIDGIRFVIDSGKVKEMGYDTDTKMQSLQEYWISKASADQRKGRAGRTGPGKCFRLYSKAEYRHFLDFPVPEIQRTPLESLVLQIKAFNMGDPRHFPFIEPPPSLVIERSITQLKRAEALNDDTSESLTPLGKVLSQLPVDIAIGKMLVLGSIFHIVEPVLTIAAALSVQCPFLKVSEENVEAFNNRHRFDSDHGDPFTLLNLFDEWIRVKNAQREPSRKWCRRHGVEEQRLYEMAKLKQQFKDLLSDIGVLEVAEKYDALEELECAVEEGRDPMPLDKRRGKKRRNQEELKQLRQLQLERERNTGKRVLRLFETEGGDREDGGEELDLRHMDFVLSCDVRKLAAAALQDLSLQDVNLLKCILCSGLYPNFAFPDEGISARRAGEPAFHTRHHPFVSVHPTSVVYGKEATLTNKDMIVYQTLLETNKLYLTNLVRSPALHALLLFAHTIDTTPDLTKLLIDNYVEIKFFNSSVAERVLTAVCQLRAMQRNMLNRKLTKIRTPLSSLLPIEEVPELPKDAPPLVCKIHKQYHGEDMDLTESLLARKLGEFFEAPVKCVIRKLPHRQAMSLFVNSETMSIGSVPAEDAVRTLEAMQASQESYLEQLKGGIRATRFLRWGCLEQSGAPTNPDHIPTTTTVGQPSSSSTLPLPVSVHMRSRYICPKCQGEFLFSIEDVRAHNAACQVSTITQIIPQQDSIPTDSETPEEPITKQSAREKPAQVFIGQRLPSPSHYDREDSPAARRTTSTQPPPTLPEPKTGATELAVAPAPPKPNSGMLSFDVGDGQDDNEELLERKRKMRKVDLFADIPEDSSKPPPQKDVDISEETTKTKEKKEKKKVVSSLGRALEELKRSATTEAKDRTTEKQKPADAEERTFDPLSDLFGLGSGRFAGGLGASSRRSTEEQSDEMSQ